jgi:hypothetical protein
MANIQNLRRSGRKPGAKNRATVAREVATAAVMAALTEKLTPEEISSLSAVQIMTMVMISEFKSGNYMNAATVAEKLAPYTTPRVAAAAHTPEIPSDLLSDPPSVGDEPGPPGGCIEG